MDLNNKIKNSTKEMSRRYFFKHYLPHRYPDLDNQIGWESAFVGTYTGWEKKHQKEFEKIALMFCDREEFEPNDFIDAVLADDFLFPAQIAQEKYWKVYLRNSSENTNENDLSEDIALAKRVKSIFVYLNGRTIEQITTNPFVKNDLIQMYAEDTIDLIVYCFSKSFIKFAKQNSMLIDFKKEQSILKEHKKILDKVKEKLGEDYMEV